MPQVRPSEGGEGPEDTASGACGRPAPVGVLTGQALEAWVAKGCRAQGVPFKVTDARTVAKVLTLLDGRPGRSGPARPGRPDARSTRAPDQTQPFRVEVPSPSASRSNDGMVEDGVDDGSLTVEIEAGPLSA